jgi:hypothetical protein
MRNRESYETMVCFRTFNHEEAIAYARGFTADALAIPTGGECVPERERPAHKLLAVQDGAVDHQGLCLCA